MSYFADWNPLTFWLFVGFPVVAAYFAIGAALCDWWARRRR